MQNRYFNAGYHFGHNPDVAVSDIDPLQHFLQYGGSEGRNPSTKFDSAFYLEQNPDVKEAGINPLLHYIQFGKSEGRKPSPAFYFPSETE